MYVEHQGGHLAVADAPDLSDMMGGVQTMDVRVYSWDGDEVVVVVVV